MAEAPTYLKLKDDMKTAMKAREKDRLQTIRMLISSLNNAKIELQRDLTEEDIVSVFSTEAKKRRESAKAYRDGDRPELADKEDAELEVITEYLPEQLTDEELVQFARQEDFAAGISAIDRRCQLESSDNNTCIAIRYWE